jgi:transposase
MRIEFLPPYSPDLNPIEEAFSCMKAWIRHNRNTALAEFTSENELSAEIVLWDAIYSVTAEKAQGWFKHSGYM